jgi:hypothetical protein
VIESLAPKTEQSSQELKFAGGAVTNLIDNDVKMVIWDLDDTFWRGTLAEGHVEFIPERGEVVRTLAARGIISSIVSKNEYNTARALLAREGLWDYFNNGIMLATPSVLPTLLTHPRLAGKSDGELKRLKQYQLLQRKFLDRRDTDLSNEEFLRSSDIRIAFNYDVEAYFGRVIELINRTNQLNYTKKRLATSNDIDLFRSSLNERGVTAACISCRDRYGDYGVIGFYALWRRTKEHRLTHLVFSCRTMNMGIEQFVYESLGKPDLIVAGDVAYGLDTHKQIDWISVEQASGEGAVLVDSDCKLLLVGGCELLQLASYCSSNRTEFVNKAITIDGAEFSVRYDDPYFIIADRNRLNHDTSLAAWTYEDALAVDRSLAEADVVFVAMRAALRHQFISTADGLRFRMENDNIQTYLTRMGDWFKKNYSVINVNTKDRLTLIEDSLKTIDQRVRPDALIFVIGANTHKPIDNFEQTVSMLYNKHCLSFCQNRRRFHFVDVSKIVSAAQTIDDQHISGQGNRALSQYVMDILGKKNRERIG